MLLFSPVWSDTRTPRKRHHNEAIISPEQARDGRNGDAKGQ